VLSLQEMRFQCLLAPSDI